MKRKLWTGLVLGLLLALVCYGAATADDSGTCGANLKWEYKSDTGELFITGSGAMGNYASSSPPWYEYEEDVRDIYIADGMTSISPYAFYKCKNLLSIEIPKSVTWIGYKAFEKCLNLNWVWIYNPKTVIGDSDYDVFKQGTRIEGWKGSTAEMYATGAGNEFKGWETSGQCGDNVWWSLSRDATEMTMSGTGSTWNMYYDLGAYHHARYIVESVRIGEGITELENDLFNEWPYLTSVTIPDSLTYIGANAFAGTGIGPSLTFSRNMREIQSRAFQNCPNLTSVTFFGCEYPAIRAYAFADGSPDLTIHGWPDSWAEYYATFLDDITFQPLDIPEADLILPESLTTINKETFVGIKAKAPLIPRTVTTIVGNPFEDSGIQVIYGYYNSEADKFAERYDYYFVEIDGD